MPQNVEARMFISRSRFRMERAWRVCCRAGLDRSCCLHPLPPRRTHGQGKGFGESVRGPVLVHPTMCA
eukprot:1682352-Prymnesium_polylepis.2